MFGFSIEKSNDVNIERCTYYYIKGNKFVKSVIRFFIFIDVYI